ncbi:MAG TPA: SpoIIE family protein phosphatase [Thermoanaerobaculia bacterium]|jgi:anti-sigma regulatory factor (Ser/Thr protein kinase)
MRTGRSVGVIDASEVAVARRAAAECAAVLRMSETAAGRASLVATELATNLIKHGGGGTMLFGSDDGALTIIALDKGRGIDNVPAAMRDGYSTAGSPGTGLGAIARGGSGFDVYSLPDRGTAVLCRVRDADRPDHDRDRGRAPRSNIVTAGVCIPKPRETESGDTWAAAETGETITICVADGLGHGPIAAQASQAAVRVLDAHADAELPRLYEEMHGALRATRGAAVGIARIYASQRRIDFCGVGNIAGIVIADENVRRTVSQPGIVGHEMRKTQTFSYPWAEESVLVLHSDGVSGSWSPANYPGLMQHDPALIAAVLYRDHCRGTDDATVVVAKAS